MVAVSSTYRRVTWNLLLMRLPTIITLLGTAMLRFLRRLLDFGPFICAAGTALGFVGLLWRVRDTPLELGAFLRVDAVSAFFGVAMLSGLTLALAPPRSPQR